MYICDTTSFYKNSIRHIYVGYGENNNSTTRYRQYF